MKRFPIHRPHMQGFNLIELIIVVALIGILATIAIPTYQRYTQDARRADAQAEMLDFVARLERNMSVNSSYLVGSPAVNQPPLPANPDGYTLSFPVAVTATTYRLRATPIGAQADDRCGLLEITNTGLMEARQVADNTIIIPNCWR